MRRPVDQAAIVVQPKNTNLYYFQKEVTQLPHLIAPTSGPPKQNLGTSLFLISMGEKFGALCIIFDLIINTH